MDSYQVPTAIATPKAFALWPFVRATLLAAGALLLTLILFLASYGVGSAIYPQWPPLHAGSVAQEIFELLAYVASLMTIVTRLPRLAQRPLAQILHVFRGCDWRVFVELFTIAIGVRIATWLLLGLFHQSRHVQSGFGDLSFGSPFAFVVFGLNLCVAAPFAEEFFFRGLLFAGLAARMPWIAAAAVSALLFGIVHGDLILFPSLAIMGFLNAVAYQRTGNLAVSIALHAASNSIVLLAIAASFL